MTDLRLREKVSQLIGRVEYSSDMDGGEIQDVVDSHDVVIGSLPRGVIWDNGLEGNTRVVNIFIQNKGGEVLLPVRSLKKRYLPGGYDFSCGENLRAGEDYLSAAVRGLKEELGLETGSLLEKGYFVPNRSKGIYCFGKVYLYRLEETNVELNINVDEIESYHWVSVNELRRLLTTELQKFKRDYKALFEMTFEV